MPLEADNPLAAGLAAATGLLAGNAQGKDQADEKRRQDALDRQNAAAQAAAIAYQQHQSSIEDADLGLRRSADTREGADLNLRRAADVRAVTQAKDQHDAAALATKAAAVEFEFSNNPAVKKARIDMAVSQAQLQRGQITAQQFALQSANAQAQIDAVRAAVAKAHGMSDADLASAQAGANLDATRAGTQRTSQDTSQSSQLFPYALGAAGQNLYGSELDNAGKLRSIQESSSAGPPELKVDYKNDARAKLVAQDATQALKMYNAKLAKLTQQDDGSYQDANGNVVKVNKPPDDTETFTVSLESIMAQVAADPKLLNAKLDEIDKDPDMISAQKAYAKQRITAAAAYKPPSAPAGGAPSGGGPFK